jgi:hypothetical protein
MTGAALRLKQEMTGAIHPGVFASELLASVGLNW